MPLTFNDWVGFGGVVILLLAYLLNLSGRIAKDGLPYLLMNITGAGLACLASYLIHYIPFVILEGSWALLSIIALINYLKRKLRLRR